MDCQKTRDQLIFYIDHDLSETNHQEITQHLQACDSCRTTYENLKVRIENIPGMKVNNPNPYFFSRIESQLEQRPTPLSRPAIILQRILVGMALIMVFSSAIIAGIYLKGEKTASNENTSTTQLSNMADQYQLSMSEADMNEIYYLTEE